MTPQDLNSKRNYWATTEARPAIVFWAVIVGLALWFWGSVVGFLLSAALDTLHFVIVSGVLVGLYMLVNSRKMHYVGRALSRWVTGWFVSIDPIGIRKTYIEEMNTKRDTLRKAIDEIRALRIALKRTHDGNHSESDEAFGSVKAALDALRQGGLNPEQEREANRTVSRLSPHVQQLEALIEKQAAHLRQYDDVMFILSRAREVCDDEIFRRKNEVKIQEEDLVESRGFLKGMRAFFAVTGHEGEDSAMDSMAVREIERQYATNMGEVEGIIDLTRDVISHSDFSNAAAIAKAKQKVEALASRSAAAIQLTAAPEKVPAR